MLIPFVNRFLHWGAVGIVSPVLVLMVMSKGAPLEGVGVVMAAMSIAAVALELPSGMLSDLLGRKRVYLASLAISLAGYALMLSARSMVAVCAAASIYGVVGADQRIYEGSAYNGRPINTPAVYAAAKAGVIGLTRHLAAYWAPHGIRVNALTPGGVESGQNDTFKQRYAARVPLGRMARADEMTGALVYLASDASSYVTGQNIVVDGGLTAW